jgi:hypothetical protein
VGLNTLKSLNLTNVYPNNYNNHNNKNNNNKNNKVKSKPIYRALRARGSKVFYTVRTFFSRSLMNERIFSLVKPNPWSETTKFPVWPGHWLTKDCHPLSVFTEKKFIINVKSLLI